VGWVCLAQDKVHWRAVVNMKMDLQVPKEARNFLTDYRLVKKNSAPCRECT
jgi:hypothetical protein